MIFFVMTVKWGKEQFGGDRTELKGYIGGAKKSIDAPVELQSSK